ncbi:hypothetical protein [Streptomyces sp. NPDC047841]
MRWFVRTAVAAVAVLVVGWVGSGGAHAHVAHSSVLATDVGPTR